LNEEVKRSLAHGDLDMGHARALLALPDSQQAAAARQIIDKGMTVRQAESLVRQLLAEKPEPGSRAVDPNVRQLQDRLSDQLGAVVKIDCNAKGKGRLVISYNSLDELDGILAHIQ